MATFEDYLFTKNTRWALWVLLGAFVALLIFIAGVAVGERHGMRERVSVMAGAQPSFMFGGMSLPAGFVTRDHGAAGTVTAVTPPIFTVQEKDGEVATIHFASTTPLSGASALAPGQFVIVVGDPASASTSDIDARFVRVMPPPPGGTSTRIEVIQRGSL